MPNPAPATSISKTRRRRPLPATFTLALVVSALSIGAIEAVSQDNDPSREIDLIATLLELGPGDNIADVGADDGRYAIPLAQRVGPDGSVYASEITDRQVEEIRDAAAAAALDNVVAIRATDEASNLPEGCCDGIMLRVVFHHLAEPAVQLGQFKAALRPDGHLLIIENRPQSGSNAPGVPENRSGMGIDRDIVVDEVTAGGFELVRELDDWPSGRYGGHYALLFRHAER